MLPEFSLILITAGQGEFTLDDRAPASVGPGMVIMLFPGVWHRFRPLPATGWHEKWIAFNGEYAHRLVRCGLLDPRRPLLRPYDPVGLEAGLDQLLAAIHHAPEANQLAWSLQALGLIPQLTGPAHLPAAGGEDDLVKRALRFIYGHAHRVIGVQEIADHLGIGRRTLERRWQASRSETLQEQIAECRFGRAARLLRETELPLKTVVGLAGFGSAESMRRQFLARTGRSPDAYRRAGPTPPPPP